MSSEVDEVLALKQEMTELRARVDSLRHADETTGTLLETFRQRVEALEKRFSAMESRMTHIDTMLMEMQGEVRRMAKSLEALKLDQSQALTELRHKMDRVLDLLQPRVDDSPVAGG